MEGEKKTARGAKLQLNRRAGLASEAVERWVSLLEARACSTCYEWLKKPVESHVAATCETAKYDLRITRET